LAALSDPSTAWDFAVIAARPRAAHKVARRVDFIALPPMNDFPHFMSLKNIAHIWDFYNREFVERFNKLFL
jgi:hypothetical protein